MSDKNSSSSTNINSGKIIDTEEFNKGLAEFYSGLATTMGAISKAADKINDMGQRLIKLCTDVGNGTCRDRSSATDPDYMITDEVAKMEHADDIEEASVPKPEETVQSAPAPVRADAPAKVEPHTLATVTNITLDDITKVIVTKIKQSRSCNEKIGALVAAYGYKQVKELPAEKYEAFLNDLAQL